MKALSASVSQSTPMGYFRIFATPVGGDKREITMFRGAPVVMQNASFVDPFTHETAQLSLPQVTIFDNPGSGDLDWLAPDTDIDIVWQNLGGFTFDWSWEGYIASYNFNLSGSESAYRVDLKGALYALDDYMSIPSFPKRPIPYEILIAQTLDQSLHPCGLGQFRVVFPTWWQVKVPEFSSPEYMLYLKPWGVTTDQLWTGFTSRNTGSWEPALTGQIQSLLSVMFAEGGAQWTLRNRGQRKPELVLRQIPDWDDPNIIEINLGAPGITINGSKDFTQRAAVIYGQGVDDAGISFSGMTISQDGKTTAFKPFAFQPQYWPRGQFGNSENTKKQVVSPFAPDSPFQLPGDLNQPPPSAVFKRRKLIRGKETLIRFQDGVDQVSAYKIAQGQLQRFAEPGITGSITLTTDLRYQDGGFCPRLLIKSGQTIKIKGIGDAPEGVLAHITHSSVDFTNMTSTLDFDTKYRDQLTVEEVKARTRDALTPLRSLQVGKYSNTVQDLVLPWSYAEGSGCVPRGSKEFFLEKLSSSSTFPYEDFTTQYPPSNPAYAPYYIRMNPVDLTNSKMNWAGEAREGLFSMSIPIRMAQTGAIRLTQFAAYDKDGHVLPVRFHVSVYSNNGVTADSMPKFPADPATLKYLKPTVGTPTYTVATPHPFYENAWESVFSDGTVPSINADLYVTDAAAGLLVGWGNYFEPAGYSPGRFSRGAARTGLLEDNASWTWDLSSTLDMQNPANNANEEYSGMLFVMIYCDDQGDQPVYFMGRFWRQEPGTT